MIRIVGTLALTMLVCVESAWGQTARPSSVAIDSVAAVEEHLDENGDGIWGLTLDTVLSVALSSRVQVIARPVVVRTTSGEWNNQIQPITLRYERRGPVALRVDGGFIPAPIGTGMLTVRPHLNPTIAQPSYYALTLPNFEPDGTRAQLASASYELGVLATLSGSRWDARVGITDSSPVRPRRVFGDTNPPRFAQVVAGGGVSPVFGMRIGVTVAHGGWAEAPDRSATLVSVEGEYGFRYTKVTAEWLRDRFERKVSGRAATASGWYAQAVQTLAPRWFVAGRIERVAIDPGLAFGPFAIGDPQHFAGIEETLGYRVTPEVTIRAGHRAREHFDRSTWDHQVSVSLVWARRWM